MRRRKKTAVVWALTAALLIGTLGGCSSHRELRELAIVEGIGVDQSEDGSFFVTFQVYQPEGTAGSSDKTSTTNQTSIVQGSGKSIFDASRNVTLQMGKKLYYANCNIFILGRAICEQSLYQVMDFLNRNHEINAKQRVFMAADKASDILTAQQDGSYIPAHDLRLLSENYYNTSEMVDQQLSDLNNRITGGITDPYLGVLQVEEDNSPGVGQQNSGSGQQGSGGGESGGSGGQSEKQIVQAEGTAVFSRQGRLLGVMDKNATRGLLWITGAVRNGVINITGPEFGQASLEIRKESTAVQASSQNGKAVIRVDISFSTGMTELRLPSGSVIDEATLKKMEQAQSEEVRQEVESALDFALRERNSDIFGFGRKLYESQPKLWRLLSKSWEQTSGKTDVKVTVTSRINHGGLIFQ